MNSDLANDVGNLANRTFKMIENYFDGVVPENDMSEGGDEQLVRFCRETVELYRENFDRLQITKALENVWELVSAANRYLVANEPWVLARDRARRKRLGSVLYHSAETVRIVASLLSPIVPDGAEAILNQMGITAPLDEIKLDALRWGGLKPGNRLVAVEGVFPRLDLETLKGSGPAQEAASAAAEAASAPLETEKISIDDFAKVEMRVGRIVSAERVPKSTKLLKLMVDIGAEVRQVVAGIGEAYDPETLQGRLVAVVTNLKPAKLMGVESNGMIVAASDQGKPVLTTFNEQVALGARLR
ncbi:MAG: methionine--tRNA ligase subunit beta [Acidobacteriota bacterium]